MAFLDEHAAFARAAKAGVFQVDSTGLLIATFTHRTSRALDPQLHTHLLIANRVHRATDGQWRALDGREVFMFQEAAGSLYQATLRTELSARLGVAWTPVTSDGQADTHGVPAALAEHFSSRRRAIEVEGAARVAVTEARLGRGLTDDERHRAYQVATYVTREAKEGRHSTEALLDRWRTEAEALGLGPERWLASALARPEPQLAFGMTIHDAATLTEDVVDEL